MTSLFKKSNSNKKPLSSDPDEERFSRDDDRSPEWYSLSGCFKPAKYAKRLPDKKGKYMVSGQLVENTKPHLYKYLTEYPNRYKENETISYGLACWMNRDGRIVHVNNN